jgi:hypothetical protein
MISLLSKIVIADVVSVIICNGLLMMMDESIEKKLSDVKL